MKYTPAEVAALLANRPNQPHYVKALIEKCVKAAVLAEREACAQVCTEIMDDFWMGDDRWEVGRHCAESIRARSKA